jgi:hypothetical protein
MSKERKSILASIMRLAWMFIRKNGYSLSEALKCAWANHKLKAAMQTRIVQFFFLKVNGEMRQAFGTLKSDMLPETQGTGRKSNDTVQVYYDCDREEYRSFKKCNLVKIV